MTEVRVQIRRTTDPAFQLPLRRESNPLPCGPENHATYLPNCAVRQGLEVVEVYRVEESAFKGHHRPALNRVLTDARAGRFDVLMVWALDRLERGGALATMQTWDRFNQAHVQVISHQEPWTEVAGDMRELLLAITGWVARMESARRSERTRAGLERGRAEGKRVVRRTGFKDTKRRKRSGYVARWERPGERERARQRALNNGQPENGASANSDEMPVSRG